MKKCLSVFLVFTLLLSAWMLPVQASSDVCISEKETCQCGFSPIIYVAALGSATLYADAGTEKEQIIFRPTNAAILTMAGDLLFPLVKLVFTKDYDAFGDSLIHAFEKMLGLLAMDEDGNSSSSITTKTDLPTDPAHGIEQSYYFAYDFRIDPFETAEKLYTYIEHVKAITGHEKVNIRASSMGGVMMLTYLKQYGSSSIDACIFQCCPLQGTAVAGDLLSKQVFVDKDALVRYAAQALPELENPLAETLLSTVIRMLDYTGAFHFLAGFANRLVDNLKDKVYDAFLIPVLGKMPGIWSFVPDESYETAKKTVLDPQVNSKLIRRLDNYHYNVQCKAGEILKGASDNGVKIMIVAGYDMQRTPLVPSYLNDSDATVDTKYAGPGATVAAINTALPQGYTQKIQDGHNHISPDNRIDASTCILPENTWFIKNMMHSSAHNGHKEMYAWFFTAKGQVNVFSNEKYPQYLQNDKKNQKLYPLENNL